MIAEVVRGVSDSLERGQVPLYFVAIALGLFAALAWGSDPFWGVAGGYLVELFLLPLMFVTFLAVPLARLVASLRDLRFGVMLVGLNFLAVPVVVWFVTRPFADSPLLVGMVLVLVCPCVDYVIVFSRLAGGDADRLAAWAPLMLLSQMLLFPVFLWLLAGREVADSVVVDAGPFWRAFMFFIVVPLAAAAVVQLMASSGTRIDGAQYGVAGWIGGVGRAVIAIGELLMVPLMMGTLAAVVATQWSAVQAFGLRLVWLVPAYAGFAVVMAAIAWGVIRVGAGLPPGSRIALVFGAVTRNSLVVMPFALVLASQPGLGITPAVVLTQTLVELLVMVVMVAVVRHGICRRAS